MKIIELLFQIVLILLATIAGTLYCLKMDLKQFMISIFGNIVVNFILTFHNVLLSISEWSTKNCEAIKIFSVKELNIIWKINSIPLETLNEIFELPTRADRIMVKRPTYDELLANLHEHYQPIAKAQTEKLANFLADNFGKDYESLYYFMRMYFDYRKEDKRKDWSDILKLPNQLWLDGEGDCEDFAMFVSGVLSNWGVSHRLTIYVSGNNAHLFNMTLDFYSIDPCAKKFGHQVFGVVPVWETSIKIA